MIPSPVNEILYSSNSTHEGTREPFMNKHSSFSSFGSIDFGSSVESELGSSTSTESESDLEEDFIAELTRQMAHSMLQEDDIEDKKAWEFSGSSESTVQFNQRDETMVGKFENLKRREEVNQYYNFKEKFFVTSLKSKQALIDEQIKAVQLCKLKQQQILQQQEEYNNRGKETNVHKQNEHKQQHWNFQGKYRGFNAGRFSGGRLTNKVSWPYFQHQQHKPTGSELRAVFLNESGSRTSASGTGVFLPREISNTSESRKKPDSLTGDVRYGLQLDQKSQSETVPAMNCKQDSGLPHEWTY